MFWKRLRGRLIGLSATLTLLSGSAAWAGFGELNMPVGVTPISRTAYDLHMLMLYLCIIIGAVVFGMMFWSIIHHRKSKGSEPAHFHHSTTAEIVWTVVPFFILVGFAIPATKGLIVMEDTSDADLTIKVTGYQWKWKYDYVEDTVSFYSNLALSSRAATYEDPTKVEHYLLEVDRELVVPVDKKVRFLITADDVIHAWWVPALGMKKDAIPGFINEIWARVDTPGVYRGQCTELCGKDHGFMPIVVVAKTQEDYEKWVAEQRLAQVTESAAAAREWKKDELIAKGEEVYGSNCATCHMPNGEGVAGSFPSIRGSEVAAGPIGEHLALVLHGRQGTSMTAFAPRLSDTELAAVVTYQRNAFGNISGDSLQPAEVRAARSL